MIWRNLADTTMKFRRLNLTRINCCYKYYSEHAVKRLTDFPTVAQIEESDWYDVWLKNNYFAARDSNKEPFKMILPPPNVTGVLHLGHALTVTIQDVLARWNRMKGYPVLWVPGFDHAGIATQAIVEKNLYKTKGISKNNLGREQFLSCVWEWKRRNEAAIRSQLKAMGASLDWSKEYFTMSENHTKAVTEAFVTLHERNLVYRDKMLINWSPTIHSALSDIEVESVEITGRTLREVPGYKKKVVFGQIVEVAFQLKDSKEELIVATTRPETLFGDVAIAVHPEDDRYAKFVGQHVWHPLRETFIPIIADPLVKRDFGTGAVKITPAHSEVDYTIAKNHSLEVIDVINEHGNMTAASKEYKDLPRFIAREKVLNELVNKGIVRNIKDHKTILPICMRSNDVIEYLLKGQWFVRCKGMAEKAVDAVKNGSLKIDPTIHEQLWFDWLANVRDWCISRQLWWGHQIPAYKVTTGNTSEWIVARSEEDAHCIAHRKYGRDVELQQDTDVLDTWLSSGILPLTVMGWPDKDFEKHYPLTLMESGHDILFFWIARMTMLGLELTNRLPFNEILLHGILCDAEGKKMSKSLGNVIAPENVINGISLEDLNKQAKESNSMGILTDRELKRTLSVNAKMFPNGIPKCGTDALRMTLCAHNIKDRTINFNVIECEVNKFFCNKIWQASRYVLLTINEDEYKEPTVFTSIDRWILSRLALMIYKVNNAFTQREFSKAVSSIKKFFYNEFCDFYLEGTKLGFKGAEKDVVCSHTYTLIRCLETSLRTFAPLMPYLADDLYSKLSERLPGFLSVSSLLETPYPLPEEFENLRDTSLDEEINKVIEVINSIRSFTGYVSKKSHLEVHIVTEDTDDCNAFNTNINLIKGVSRIKDVSVFLTKDYDVQKGAVCYTHGSKCKLVLSSQDTSLIDQFKMNLERRKSEIQEKMKKLSKSSKSAREKVKLEEKIRLLEQEMETLPVIT